MRFMSASLTSRLVTETTSVFGPDGQFSGTAIAELRVRPGMTRAEIEGDLTAIDASCRPAQRRDVAHAVGRLAVRTKRRVHDQGENALAAETMVDDLMRYPLDVVEHACEYWIEGGREAKFFPSWPELREICDRRMSGRLRLRRALAWMLENAA